MNSYTIGRNRDPFFQVSFLHEASLGRLVRRDPAQEQHDVEQLKMFQTERRRRLREHQHSYRPRNTHPR